MGCLRILLDTSSITIAHDLCNQWLYIDWKGPQNEQSVRAGCEQVLTFLRLTKCQKILNDNTNVTGDWQEASRWIGEEFIRSLAEAGLRYLAWVYSPNYLSRRAVDSTLAFVTCPMVVSFEDLASAYTWLRESVRPQPHIRLT